MSSGTAATQSIQTCRSLELKERGLKVVNMVVGARQAAGLSVSRLAADLLGFSAHRRPLEGSHSTVPKRDNVH